MKGQSTIHVPETTSSKKNYKSHLTTNGTPIPCKKISRYTPANEKYTISILAGKPTVLSANRFRHLLQNDKPEKSKADCGGRPRRNRQV